MHPRTVSRQLIRDFCPYPCKAKSVGCLFWWAVRNSNPYKIAIYSHFHGILCFYCAFCPQKSAAFSAWAASINFFSRSSAYTSMVVLIWA